MISVPRSRRGEEPYRHGSETRFLCYEDERWFRNRHLNYPGVITRKVLSLIFLRPLRLRVTAPSGVGYF